VGADTSQELGCGLVASGSDSSRLEDLLTKLDVTDSEGKLLLLGRLGCGKVLDQEVFEQGGHLDVGDALDVLESFLSGREWLEGLKFDLFAESLKVVYSFLNLGDLATSLVVLFFLEKAVALSTFV
jgi:hypothetical protein